RRRGRTDDADAVPPGERLRLPRVAYEELAQRGHDHRNRRRARVDDGDLLCRRQSADLAQVPLPAAGTALRGASQGLGVRMAETEGFEPSVRESPVRRFSKPLVSATHPRLRDHRAQALPGGRSSTVTKAAGYISRFP